MTDIRFQNGTDEYSKFIREYDWGNTVLGPMEAWPQSLLTAFDIALFSGDPVVIYWGKDLIRLYNPAYAKLIAQNHPGSLGKPGNSIPEIWDAMGAELQECYLSGKQGSVEHIRIPFSRHGQTEECYFFYFYHPLYNENREVAGIYLRVKEETALEVSLHESEQRNRLAIEASNMGTFEWNIKSSQFISSFRTSEIFGFSSNERIDLEKLIGRIHEDDRETRLNSHHEALDTGFLFYETRIIWPDNSVHWVKLNGKVLYDENGKADKMYGTVLDITDQKNTIRELEESEKRFKTLTDTVPAMIWTSNTEKLCDFFNRGWLDFTGRTMKEELGNGWTAMVHPEDLDRCMSIYSSAFDARKKFSMEYRLKRFDGKYRWVSDDATPRYNIDGDFIGYIGACVDIQEKKMAREELERKVLERTSELNKRNSELQEQKEFVDAILDSSVDIISVFDKDLRYVKMNKKAKEMYAGGTDELIGKKVNEAFSAIKESGMYNDLLQSLKGELIHAPKYRSVIFDTYFDNFYIPLGDGKNNIYGVLLLSHDNSEIIKASEKLEKTNLMLEEKNRELERSNKELESFSYVASHDLQEPLRKIRTFAELVRKNFHDKETAGKYFSKIEASAKRMGDLIRAVLNYSRLSRTDDHFQVVDLNEILENVKSDFELLIEEKKVKIKRTELPAIIGIPLQLNQLFSNLIGNSIKFSAENPVIEIQSSIIDLMPEHPDILPGKKYVELIFKDNGIGFEQQYSDQVFTIFKRLHGMQEYAGTGIGLALCKKIVENHHGLIAVQSEPGKGTEFFIYLPVD